MAQVVAPQQRGMGPGFWPVTILLTVLSIAQGVFVTYYDIGKILPQAADRAVDIDNLFKFMAVFGDAIAIYVFGYTLYFCIVWRRKASDPPDAIGIQVHDHPALEFWWTLIPAVLLVVLAVLSIQVWYKVQYATDTSAAMSTEVIAHQFGYSFRYPGLDKPVDDEMHLPLNQPVRVLVTAQDVLHSFWVPEMRLKADTVPGLVQNLNFTPTRIGTYTIECTEFCGIGHSMMKATLIVESPEQFQSWLDQQKQKQAQAAAAAPAVKK